MTAFPRVLLAERRCLSCGCIFARVPDKTIDPERCGFCLAHLDVDPGWIEGYTLDVQPDGLELIPSETNEP